MPALGPPFVRPRASPRPSVVETKRTSAVTDGRLSIATDGGYRTAQWVRNWRTDSSQAPPLERNSAEFLEAGAERETMPMLTCLQQLQDVELRLAAVRSSLASSYMHGQLSTDTAGGVGGFESFPNQQADRTSPPEASRVLTMASRTGDLLPLPPQANSAGKGEDSVSLHSQDGNPSSGEDTVRGSPVDAPLTMRRLRIASDAWAQLDRDRQLRQQHVIDQVILNPLDTRQAKAARWARSAAPQRRPTRKTNSDTAPGPGGTTFFGEALPAPKSKKDVSFQPLCFGLKVPVLHPYSIRRLVWLAFGVACVAYEAVAIPVYISFGVRPQGVWFLITSFMNLYFMVDVVLAFLTAFYDSDEDLIVDPKLIAGHYAKTWLVCDVAAAVPWEWLDYESSASLVRIMKVVRMFRLIPLLVKLRNRLSHMEVFLDGNRMVSFAAGISRVLICLGFAAHWCTCAWYGLGRTETDGPTWLDDYSSEDRFRQYVWALYFTITTMTTVGYGDITPTNYNEALFTLVLLPIASVGFAVLMGTLIDYMGSLNSKGRTRAERRSRLAQYMKFRMVPDHLAARVRQYLLFVWDTKEDYDKYEEELKESLSSVLKEELCYHLYGRILQRAPFLAFMKNYNSCVRLLASMVQTEHLDQGDHLFRIGQPNVEVHVLLSGSVWLSLNENLGVVEERKASVSQAGGRPGGRDKDTFKLPRQSSLIPAHLRGFVAQSVSPKRIINKFRQEKETLLISGPRRGSHDKDMFPANFEGRALAGAATKLHLHDIAMRRAVRVVQRRWRERHGHLSSPATLPHRLSRKGDFVRQLLVRMRSHLVHAPCYFGEACLWVPFDQWERTPPPTYLYAARCETRVELIKFHRDSLKMVISNFSPWLLERFEFFREAVEESVANIVEQAKEDNDVNVGPSRIVFETTVGHQMSDKSAQSAKSGVCAASSLQIDNVNGHSRKSPATSWCLPEEGDEGKSSGSFEHSHRLGLDGAAEFHAVMPTTSPHVPSQTSS